MQRKSLLIVVVSLAVVLGSVLAAGAQVPPPARTFSAAPSSQALLPPYSLGTAFTYQGQLKSSGTPVNGTCDIGFHLYDDPGAGNEIGTPLTPTITATNGIFTTLLDFGAGALTGDARWLEMRVSCPHGAGSFIALSPREALAPAPMALALPGLWTQQNPYSPNLIGGFNGNVITPSVTGAAIGGGGRVNNINRILDGADYSVIGGGLNNNAGGGASTIGGGVANSTAAEYTVVAGGSSNHANVNYSTVSGGQNNAITGAAHHAFIGGGENNVVGFNSDHSLIVGGNGNSIAQQGAFESVIVGGQGNIITNSWATIGGGIDNVITGSFSTIAGGNGNFASDTDATVGGGDTNRARAHDATVSGGGSNTASGSFATVPGGVFNIAQGQGSFAAGQNAQALHDGSFVWADGSNGVFASIGPNMFMVRAAGGINMYSNGNSTSGVTLAPGSGSWSMVSDRSAKMNFEPVDGQGVLAQLAAIPVETWSYKTQDASIRHIGPMAQDFKAAFGVGENDTNISTVDAQGVALAAIQGLNQLVQAQQAELSALKDERAAQQQQLAALDARVSAQDARLSALEQAAGTNGVAARSSDTFSALGLLLLGGLTGAAALLFFQRHGLVARK